MSADTPDVLTAEEVEAGARALFEHFHGTESAEKYAGTYSWPPPEQHLPWWQDAARAVLAARAKDELPEGVIARIDVMDEGIRVNLRAAMPRMAFAEMLRVIADAYEHDNIERVE